MKSTSFLAGGTFPKFLGVTLSGMLLLGLFLSVPSYGKSGREIDASVDLDKTK